MWNIAVEREDGCGTLNVTRESKGESIIPVSRSFKNVLPK